MKITKMNLLNIITLIISLILMIFSSVVLIFGKNQNYVLNDFRLIALLGVIISLIVFNGVDLSIIKNKLEEEKQDGIE